MPLAQLNETVIYYEDYGQGLPLIFIHGLGGNHSMYKPQIEFFQKDYRVIAIDLRGSGKSGKLQVPAKKILEIQCLDLAALLDYLNISQAVLIGVSYGGVLAQKFTYLFPQRVKSLIISDSFCDTRPLSLSRLFYLLSIYLSLFHYIPRKWLAYLGKKQYARWPTAAEEIRRMALEMRRHETSKQRLALCWLNFTNFLPEIQQNVLGIVGDHLEIGVELMKQLSDLLPHCQLEILPDAFDPSNLCQPEKFNHLVLNFLKENVF